MNKKLIAIILAITAAISPCVTRAQVNVQKTSGTNAITGNLVIGDGKQLSATGTGAIISTSGTATSVALGNVTGLGSGVATLLAGASSGTGGPAGTASPTFTGTTANGNVTATGNGTFSGTGTHTFGTTNTVTMAAGVLTTTGAANFGGGAVIGGGAVWSTAYTALPADSISRLVTGVTGGTGYVQSTTGAALNALSIDGGTVAIRTGNFATVATFSNTGETTLAGNLTVSGTGTSSFSGTTASTSTTTGTVTIAGGASAQGAIFGGTFGGGVQALSGAGAANVTTLTTALTSTGVADAITLANGLNGQIKIVIHDVDGGSSVLTPTTKTGFSTVTFTNAGDTVVMQYLNTRGWFVLSSYGAVVAP